MAESRARSLANLANESAISVDGTSFDVGISSASPSKELDIGGKATVNVGSAASAVTIDGVAGVVTAVKFVGDGAGLTGVANTDFVVSTATTTVRMVVTGGVNVTGVVTASSFTGDGANLTNVGVDTATVDTGSLKVSGISTLAGYVSLGSTVGAAASIYFPDDKGINFGNNPEGDLQIYHDGSNSYIKDSGTGGLLINSSGFDVLNVADDEYMARFTQNEGVKLYFDSKERFETQDDGIEVSHAGTANTMRMHAGGSVGVGIGVTTTTGRKAVGAAGTVKGQIVYNETDNVVEVYTGIGWVGIATKGISASGGVKIEDGDDIYHVFNSDSTDNFTVATGNIAGAKVLIVGGGGASANDNGCAGGAGGVAYGSNMPFTPGIYPVRVGVGGSANQNRDNDVECNGQPSRLTCPVGVVTGFGGQGSSNQVGNPYALYETWGSDWIMNPYGDSPAITPNTLFGSGASGRITNPTSMEQSPTPVTTYGQPARPTFGGTIANYGGQGGPATNGGYWNCGGGGGASGVQGGNANPATPSPTRSLGGAGQPFPEFPAPVISPGIPSPFRPDFESEVGPTGLFGGGGGGGFENPAFYGNGGPGGGGDGDSGNANASAIKGTYGTGGGSGSFGGGSPGSLVPEVGGPGIIIIKYTV